MLIYFLQFSYPQTALCFMFVKLKWGGKGGTSLKWGTMAPLDTSWRRHCTQ